MGCGTSRNRWDRDFVRFLRVDIVTLTTNGKYIEKASKESSFIVFVSSPD